ncbi:uncharacterized protein LOC106163386 [Lingula anatina]|uniref:Autophagy-related protein 27 n=1 Tax=Lingula anatina TaxID=7574 RepID=A0A1S3IG01_LINAN|nr:uncharacterized protein LOC106163386 [Lingula anatina]|eukprot:XP_013396399.1 uncharacterized protein LOC106163386 [Lingula anatina]
MARRQSGRSVPNTTTVLFVLLLLLFVRASHSQSCVKIDSCSCRNENGVLNLRPLASSDGTARFKATSSDLFTYSWNPCTRFTANKGPTGGCEDVAVCQVDMYTNGYSLGSQATATFNMTSQGAFQVVYSATDTSGTTRTSHVQLICDPSKEGDFVAEGERSDMPTNYFMTLMSKYACFQEEEPDSLSIGSLLIIIVLVFAVTYLGVGVGYRYFIQQERGANVIPQREMWQAIPALVKDGFLFTKNKFKKGDYDPVT